MCSFVIPPLPIILCFLSPWTDHQSVFCHDKLVHIFYLDSYNMNTVFGEGASSASPSQQSFWDSSTLFYVWVHSFWLLSDIPRFGYAIVYLFFYWSRFMGFFSQLGIITNKDSMSICVLISVEVCISFYLEYKLRG